MKNNKDAFEVLKALMNPMNKLMDKGFEREYIAYVLLTFSYHELIKTHGKKGFNDILKDIKDSDTSK